MKRRNFTLIELLTVIGIITILAGLLIPAVVSSRRQGMITQARADMNAIKMALLGVERDYGTIFKATNPAATNPSFSFYCIKKAKDSGKEGTGSKSSVSAVRISSKPQLVLGGNTNKFGSSNVTRMEDGYYGMIAELSDPREISKISMDNLNINKRLIRYLDPRPDYAFKVAETMWQDPWGTPYVVMIDSDNDGKVYIPSVSSHVVSTSSITNMDGSNLELSGKVFLYSYGPNGTDDGSFNVENGGKKGTDDIRGWEK